MDQYGRPNWDVFWMTQCFLIAQRSIDPRTKHGCIAIDEDNHVISMGYNSFPAGIDDSSLPLVSPAKLLVIRHAEENLISNTTRPLKGSTVIITGKPCIRCLCSLITAKVAKVIYGPVKSACMDDAVAENLYKIITDQNKIQLMEFKNSEEVYLLLDRTKDYLKIKDC